MQVLYQLSYTPKGLLILAVCGQAARGGILTESGVANFEALAPDLVRRLDYQAKLRLVVETANEVWG